MLSASLLLTGALGVMQERTYSEYGPHWREGVFYTVSVSHQDLTCTLTDEYFIALPFVTIVYFPHQGHTTRILLDRRTVKHLARVALGIFRAHGELRDSANMRIGRESINIGACIPLFLLAPAPESRSAESELCVNEFSVDGTKGCQSLPQRVDFPERMEQQTGAWSINGLYRIVAVHDGDQQTVIPVRPSGLVLAGATKTTCRCIRIQSINREMQITLLQ